MIIDAMVKIVIMTQLFLICMGIYMLGKELEGIRKLLEKKKEGKEGE